MAKLTKKMLSDLERLSKKIKNPYFEKTFETQLDTFVCNRRSIGTFEKLLRTCFGPNVANIISYVLDFEEEEFQQFKESLQKSKIDKNTIDFLTKISLKYGYYFSNHKSIKKMPLSLDSLSFEIKYDPEVGFYMEFEFWRGFDSFKISQIPIGALEIATAFLNSIEIGYSKLKKDIPNLELDLQKQSLKELKNIIEKISLIIDSEKKK